VIRRKIISLPITFFPRAMSEILIGCSLKDLKVGICQISGFPIVLFFPGLAADIAPAPMVISSAAGVRKPSCGHTPKSSNYDTRNSLDESILESTRA